MIIELKLASNPAAHREIVSQVMTYAAFLHGSDVKILERGPLHWLLMDAERGSILEAAQAQDEEGAVDAESFEATLQGFWMREASGWSWCWVRFRPSWRGSLPIWTLSLPSH